MNTQIDLGYFQEKIGLLNRDIDRYAQSSGDLARTLVRLAMTANEGAVKKELGIEWQSHETAPKSGDLFLADIGYPWPVLCCWHDLHQEWAYADYQINMVDGEYNDPYFQAEYEKTHGLKAWMPLPKIIK